MSRYSVSHSEGKYASGSDELVLHNKLGITCAEEMDGAMGYEGARGLEG